MDEAVAGCVQKDLHRALLARFPETQEEEKWVEDSLAQAMESLSLDQEEQILFDVYGFPSDIGEEEKESFDDFSTFECTGNLHYSCNSKQWKAQYEVLQKLKHEIDRKLDKGFPEDVRKAYKLALHRNPEFLEEQGLLFTSAVKGSSSGIDFGSAADLLLNHLNTKSQLFGEHVLGRHVRWSDLNPKAQEVVMSGCFQFAPKPDSAGRAVLFQSTHILVGIMGDAPDEATILSAARAHWYMVMSCLQTNPQMLNHGMVFVIFNISEKTMSVQNYLQCHRRCVHEPFRLRACHCFYMDPKMQVRYKTMELASLITMVAFRRFRFRTHYGENVSDLRTKMASFGIDPASSPWKECQNDGTGWSRERHQAWIERQQHRERHEGISKESSCGFAMAGGSEIRRFDVLFGRSKQALEHTGTRRCKVLIAMHQSAYEQSDAQGKTRIANEIVDGIYESGGRFLRWNCGEWVQVSLVVARQKIAHNFRFLRSKRKK